jgi:hypothetical protein
MISFSFFVSTPDFKVASLKSSMSDLPFLFFTIVPSIFLFFFLRYVQPRKIISWSKHLKTSTSLLQNAHVTLIRKLF